MDTTSQLPFMREVGTATQLIVAGQPFIMLAGEVHNSSSSSLAYMAPIWDKLVALHCNTALVPFSWELIEPEEGRFDFALVDGLIEAARRHGLRLVPLWFGTWKNAMGTYAPGWVKTDLARFPRAQYKPGQNGGDLSSLGEETCRADARAFAALMRHLREVDGQDHTVIMVQVENEAGILGAARDHSALAEAAFGQAVPAALMDHLQTHGKTLLPEMAEAWGAAGRRSAGTWTEVFGLASSEVFMAWHIGRYIDRVAAAGQAEYALPLYVNAWLVQHEFQEPGEYPSGGPVSRVLDVWQCAAPHICLLAPDIYLIDFASVCQSYTRGGNPLFIPEAHRDLSACANVFYALGQHDALGFSPFGIEGTSDEPAALLAQSYRLLGDMLPVVAAYQGSGQMIGVLQNDEMTYEVELGGYVLRIQFATKRLENRAPGAGLIIATAPDEYIVAGHGFGVDFLPKPGGLPNVDFLWLYEGDYRAGKWVPGRRLNGDEYMLRLDDVPSVRRTKVYRHA